MGGVAWLAQGVLEVKPMRVSYGAAQRGSHKPHEANYIQNIISQN